MATTEDPKKATLNSASGGTSSTTSTTAHRYAWEPSIHPLSALNVSAVPWVGQYDLKDAYQKWLAQHGSSIPGVQESPEWWDAAGQAFQQAATRPAFAEEFLKPAAVATVESAKANAPYMATISGQRPTPALPAALQLQDANGNWDERAMHAARKSLTNTIRGVDNPDTQAFNEELKRRYPGMDVREAARKARADIDGYLDGGKVGGFLQAAIPAAYATAGLTDAQNRIRGLSAPNQKPAPGPLPQQDMGLARQIGTAQQNANTGLSEMERRKLDEQNQRAFAGAAGAIQQTGDSSNIGAHLAALYGKQQQGNVNQALASEQVRSQRQGELGNLLGQQRQQQNAIAAANMHLYDQRLNQYNTDEFSRRGDLNAAQTDKWNMYNLLAGQGANAARQYAAGRPGPQYKDWNSDQAIRLANQTLYNEANAGKAQGQAPLPMGVSAGSVNGAPHPYVMGAGPQFDPARATYGPAQPQQQFNLMQGPGNHYGTSRAPFPQTYRSHGDMLNSLGLNNPENLQ